DFDAPDTELVNLRVELSYSDQKIDQEYVAGSSTCDDPANPCGLTGGFPAGGFASVNADHRYETTGLLIKNTAYLDTGMIAHELRTGIEYTHRKRLDANSAPGGVDKRLALFVVDDMSMGNFTLSPELRYETQEIGGSGYGTYNNSALMGGVSGTVDLGGGFKLLGGAWYNENLPILDDLTNPGFIVQSEKGVTYEAGLSFDAFDVFADADALKTKVTAFTTNIWDGTTYSGVDQVDLDGVEFELSYAHPAFYADFNAAVIRGTINDTSADFNWAPADSVQLTLGKRFMGDQLDISLETTHGFAQNRTSGTSGATAPSASFTTYDLSASYTPDSGWAKGVEFRAAVENLTDETYRPYLS
ncbi:MAG: TonB-dependent receptor, partial [Pseudomonadota bacterium]|nr:TonB-dependent receptor [Pseudomonadota bacterium]